MSKSNFGDSNVRTLTSGTDPSLSSNERFRRLIELSTDYYWELDVEGRFSTILHGDPRGRETAASRLLGKTRWEVDGTPLRGDWTEHRAMLESRQPFSGLIVERPGPDGTVRYLESAGCPRYDESGEFCGYSGITREVTDEVYAQRLVKLDRELTDLFTSCDTVDVPRRALELVCRHLNWDRARYWVLSPSRGAAQAEATVCLGETTRGSVSRAERAADRQMSKYLITTASEFGDILWVNDLSKVEGFPDYRRSDAALVVPVSLRGRAIGVIDIRDARIGAPKESLKHFLRRLGVHLANTYEREFTLRQLRESKEKYSSTIELAAIGISHISVDGYFLHANRQLQQMLGYSERELKEKTVWDVSHPDDRHLTDTMVEKITLRELDSFTVEKRYIAQDGRIVWVRINTVVKWDARDRPMYHISTVEDISDRKKAEERVAFLATHDELTNLSNRVYFNEQLGRAIRSHHRQGSRRLAVLFVDLDRFKIINDSLGHDAGDSLLREAADRIRRCVRGSDRVARHGGDEFVVLLENIASIEAAEDVARKIIAAIHEPIRLKRHECRVTASVGIAVYPDHGMDPGMLTRNADVAMYAAKENGKNCCQVFSVDLEPMSVERLTLEQHLQHALERREFRIQYQPKVDARTGEIVGVEALLRWWNHELGTITPAQFIPVAEDTGLIVPIGKWLLREACAQSVSWQRAGLPGITMSVNLSPRQFSDPSLIDDVNEILEQTHMSPELLELEITESLLVSDISRAIEVATNLRSLGIRFAIDDFGTGYSSFVQLKRFPLDSLKIDRSFIRDLPSSKEDKAITEAIIAMAKTLGASVVAEGVETRGQREFLVASDCDQIQGFLFGKPCHPDAIVKALRNHQHGMPAVAAVGLI